MALLSDEAEARGLEYALRLRADQHRLGSGQAIGAVGGGALAQLDLGHRPYLHSRPRP